MKFLEAIKFMQDGAIVGIISLTGKRLTHLQCKFNDKGEIQMRNAYDNFYKSLWTEWYPLDQKDNPFSDYIDFDNWKIVRPPKLHSFDEAIKYFKSHKKIYRKDNEKAFLKRGILNMNLSSDDILSDDWIIEGSDYLDDWITED